MFGLTGTHLLILLAVVLLLFGATRLPGLAKGLGQSMRIFRNEVKAMKNEDDGKDKNPSSDGSASDGGSPSTAPHSSDANESSSHPKS